MGDSMGVKLTELTIPHTGTFMVPVCSKDSSSMTSYLKVFWDFNGTEWSASVKCNGDSWSSFHITRTSDALILKAELLDAMETLADKHDCVLDRHVLSQYLDLDSYVPFKDEFLEDYGFDDGQYQIEADILDRTITIYRNGTQRDVMADVHVPSDKNMALILLREIRCLNTLLEWSTFEGKPYKPMDIGIVEGHFSVAL